MNAISSLMVRPSLDRDIEPELDSLLTDRWAPARWQRIDDIEELSWPLQQLAVSLPGNAWRAYADGAYIAFAAGEAAGHDTLAVRFFDASGTLCAAGAWSRNADGVWSLSQVIA